MNRKKIITTYLLKYKYSVTQYKLMTTAARIIIVYTFKYILCRYEKIIFFLHDLPVI